MAELVATTGILRGLVLALEDQIGNEWILGRDPDLSNIVLEDSKVSRQHLVIRKRDDEFYLENLSSTNPVYVNGTEAKQEILLQEGDRVQIGGSTFHFYKEQRRLEEELPRLEEKETIFREEEIAALPESRLELSIPSRFILKVISGPNTGAEYALEAEKPYLIGSDTTTCDIVFHDLSVSREHARIYVEKEGKIFIEDLGSRNGVVIDKERVEGKRVLLPNNPVTVGTSMFLIIDKEAPSMTLISPTDEEEVPLEEEIIEEEIEKKPRSALFSPSAMLLTVILAGLLLLLAIAAISLFKEDKVTHPIRDYHQEISQALKPFPGVRYTYNESTGKLFLVGHVSTEVEKKALLNSLQGISCFRGIEDNVVVDEAVWQEMNLLISKYSEFEGVSIHSPEPGKFVMTGYLKTYKQKAALTDFINVNFLYLSLLENKVVVEEEVLDEAKSRLLEKGINSVNVEFLNGQLTLTGYIGSQKSEDLQKLVDDFSNIWGVRSVRNFVAILSPEQGVVDLNEKYPERYLVTGYSKYGDINLNVVINGRILMRGDTIDSMMITSIQPHTIFFEKDGLKYKLEYNK